MTQKAEKTYWNGEPAHYRRVLVRVAESTEGTPPLAWWRGLEGTVRRAVEVRCGAMAPFYLDDDDVPEEIHTRNQRALEEDPKLRALAAALKLDRDERNRRPGQAGDGWDKVTKGRGYPDWGHRSLPVAYVVGLAPAVEREGRETR